LIDSVSEWCYNNDMTYKNIDNILQWTGAVAIVLGHAFNAMGPEMYPWNIIVFAIGTVMFMLWALRVGNRPQLMVNVVSLAIGILGLVKAIS
jgi:hypothetical protein